MTSIETVQRDYIVVRILLDAQSRKELNRMGGHTSIPIAMDYDVKEETMS